MPPFTFLKSVLNDFRAKRRGDRRIAPRGVRGRIYERQDGSTDSSNNPNVPTKTTFHVTARVIRADGSPDEYYDL